MFCSAVLYLRRAWVGRPGEQLIVSELRSRRNALRRTRAVVNVELAVWVGGHGQKLQQREPILSQLDHAELHQTMGVIDNTPLQWDESDRSASERRLHPPSHRWTDSRGSQTSSRSRPHPSGFWWMRSSGRRGETSDTPRTSRRTLNTTNSRKPNEHVLALHDAHLVSKARSKSPSRASRAAFNTQSRSSMKTYAIPRS